MSSSKKICSSDKEELIHELAITFGERKINVWSDSQNKKRTVQKFFYQPLVDLDCGSTQVRGNLLHLVVTMWTTALESAVEEKLRAIFTGQMLTIQAKPINEVMLEWREAPPGVEVPELAISFSHSPMKQAFVVRCDNENIAKKYGELIQRSPQSIALGLHLAVITQGNQHSWKVNFPTVSAPIRCPEFNENLENRFKQFEKDVAEVRRKHVEISKHVRTVNESLCARITELEERDKNDESRMSTSTTESVCNIGTFLLKTQTNSALKLTLMTAIPNHDSVNAIPNIICTEWRSNALYRMDEDALYSYLHFDSKRYGPIYGLGTDSSGFLYVLNKDSRSGFVLRKFSSRKEEINSECMEKIIPLDIQNFVIRNDTIYAQTAQNVHITPLDLSPKVTSLVKSGQMKVVRLPRGTFTSGVFDVNARGEMFLFCERSCDLLHLSHDGHFIQDFNVIDVTGLDFRPQVGYVCAYDEGNVLLSVHPHYQNSGAVICFNFDAANDRFKNPRIVYSTIYSQTSQIIRVGDCVAVCQVNLKNGNPSLKLYEVSDQ
ncbi:uncharacterized protein LOC141908827 [Tubulanus polymorphus]|uniref:uncharacterized protein LOC141908827 n=1 Tax=Tubulanus polymorphus TaxID=672921 RepID=UPI003DA2EB84